MHIVKDRERLSSDEGASECFTLNCHAWMSKELNRCFDLKIPQLMPGEKGVGSDQVLLDSLDF